VVDNAVVVAVQVVQVEQMVEMVAQGVNQVTDLLEATQQISVQAEAQAAEAVMKALLNMLAAREEMVMQALFI
jgi:hypothetical protein